MDIRIYCKANISTSSHLLMIRTLNTFNLYRLLHAQTSFNNLYIAYMLRVQIESSFYS